MWYTLNWNVVPSLPLQTFKGLENWVVRVDRTPPRWLLDHIT
jgi:hypothetical protein